MMIRYNHCHIQHQILFAHFLRFDFIAFLIWNMFEFYFYVYDYSHLCAAHTFAFQAPKYTVPTQIGLWDGM